jgi:hypothetical protein
MTASSSNQLSAEEVCLILKASGEAQVSVLKFRDLYVKFGRPTEPQKNDVGQQAPITPEAEISEQAKQVADAAIQQEAVLTKEERLALLAIEEPEELERLLMSGELENDRCGEVTNEEADDS